MELSVMARQATSSAPPELFPARSVTSSRRLPGRRTMVGFGKAATRGVRAVGGGGEKVVVGGVRARRSRTGMAARHPELYVGLPLDVISDSKTLNHTRAITLGLKALKLLGADGVEVPVWWGVVENETMGQYDWSGYLELIKMIQDAGLRVHVSMCFHSSTAPEISLPSWVSSIGDADPDIYFTDKEGLRDKQCLSLAVDDLPVLGGKTPIQVYTDFFQSFQAFFSDFIGPTITDIAIGLGPGGELRYPSLSSASKQQEVAGVGEFQCYDKHMLSNLKQQAVKSGNHFWGLTGPHDAPQYDQSPNTGNFFKENSGSWESEYGNFFLTWYSNQLLSHGDRLLAAASYVFGGYPVKLSGKVPLMHSWYKTRSHPSELTAGYYNTDSRDGYDAVAEMFARNSGRMILSGMDLSDENHPQAARASPELLLAQIMAACKKHGVRVSGENSAISSAANGFNKIKDNILGGESTSRSNLIDSFTYQRMGAYFFSPEHWPQFTDFIRSIDRLGLHSDDLLSDEEGSTSLSPDTTTDQSRRMQTA